MFIGIAICTIYARCFLLNNVHYQENKIFFSSSVQMISTALQNIYKI